MAIRHEDIAFRRNGYPGRLIEGVRATSLYALLAECHQHRTSRTNLKTWWPLVMPFGPLADSPSTVSLALASLAHTFPSASTVNPWGNANIPPPKLVRSFPEGSNFKIGGSERPTQVAAPAGSVLKQR